MQACRLTCDENSIGAMILLLTHSIFFIDSEDIHFEMSNLAAWKQRNAAKKYAQVDHFDKFVNMYRSIYLMNWFETEPVLSTRLCRFRQDFNIRYNTGQLSQ